VLWAPANRSFSAGNNLAAERASGDVLCLLYDDVEPLGPRWLDRMLASLTDDVGVVGAQLVHPRQPLLAGTRRDLTVEHRGITFVPVLGEVPRAVDIRGDRPVVDGRTQEVAAVTGGCLVVERRTYMELGGLDEGYVYGAEDVDFCWRARRAGRRTCVVHDAVLLHHHGSGPHGDDPAARSRHEAANWSRFAARHGEDVSRAVTLDRLTGRAVLSRTRYRVAVLPAPGARWGDAAEALHQALGGTGWEADPPDGVGGRHVRAARVVRDDADLVLAVGPGIEPEALARPGRTRAVWLPEGRAAEPAGSSMDGWDVVVTTRDPAGAISTLRDALIARMGASRWDSGRLRTK
jgi:GT2 family glycosyltransferase